MVDLSVLRRFTSDPAGRSVTFSRLTGQFLECFGSQSDVQNLVFFTDLASACLEELSLNDERFALTCRLPSGRIVWVRKQRLSRRHLEEVSPLRLRAVVSALGLFLPWVQSSRYRRDAEDITEPPPPLPAAEQHLSRRGCRLSRALGSDSVNWAPFPPQHRRRAAAVSSRRPALSVGVPADGRPGSGLLRQAAGRLGGRRGGEARILRLGSVMITARYRGSCTAPSLSSRCTAQAQNHRKGKSVSGRACARPCVGVWGWWGCYRCFY